MIVLIDNYDSFTYNLYQLVGELNPDLYVVRNDKCTVEDIDRLAPSHIIISPGPGNPDQAGICLETIEKLGSKYPILGVCLGHQAIGQAYGGKVVHAPQVVHGKADRVYFKEPCPLFAGLKEGFPCARYHSLLVDSSSLPDCLKITAVTKAGEIMGLMHEKYKVYGVQFHPESIMTPDGRVILKNFLKL